MRRVLSTWASMRSICEREVRVSVRQWAGIEGDQRRDETTHLRSASSNPGSVFLGPGVGLVVRARAGRKSLSRQEGELGSPLVSVRRDGGNATERLVRLRDRRRVRSPGSEGLEREG